VVGALTWLQCAGDDWVQWLLFSVFTVASLLLLRPRLVVRFAATGAGGNTPLPDFVGGVAVQVDDLEPGAVGKVELRGTSWNARSHQAARIPRGSRCIVERVEGLTLWIVPQQGDH